ncbi:MAG: hypothetical protein IKR59_06615, partial [Lachnospiraceae bacterium]|nr:hypothetical protein [Lachnospiraceae bacterium]
MTLLTILLGLALVAASAVISSAFYMVSLKEKAEKTCREATESMSSVIEAHELEFLEGYAEKIWAVYAEYREELEQIEAGSISFETPAEREDYFSKLTEGIFPPRVGFGMSYDMVVFNNTYIRLMQDLDVIAYTNGLTRGCLWIYDAEYGNVISLMDSSSETSLLYDFPGSLVTVPDARIKTALESGTQTGFLNGEECHALCPVHDENGALTAFIYYYMNNAGISSGVRLFAVYTAAIMLAAMIIISLVIMLFADRLIAGKIRRLSSAADAFTSEIGSGKPEKVSAKITARDEIGDLSGKFDLMQDTILGYIDSLAEKTSKEEKMKTELALAARIQAEALPKDRFRKGAVVLDSFLKPAREVGGDLYDYFMLDETRLFFCLADVSGKGIPAALF